MSFYWSYTFLLKLLILIRSWLHIVRTMDIFLIVFFHTHTLSHSLSHTPTPHTPTHSRGTTSPLRGFKSQERPSSLFGNHPCPRHAHSSVRKVTVLVHFLHFFSPLLVGWPLTRLPHFILCWPECLRAFLHLLSCLHPVDVIHAHEFFCCSLALIHIHTHTPPHTHTGLHAHTPHPSSPSHTHTHTPLSLTHRVQKQRLWEKSCQWIATHESRVRVETRRIAGEDLEVWRWIQVSGRGGGESERG